MGAARVLLVWVIALLGAWALRTLIPSSWFVYATHAEVSYAYPVNRIAFWLCLIAASVVTVGVIIRLCVQDLRIHF
jgi:hypothetical protein